MINSKYLCRQHLLGEHKELHMLAGCIIKHKNITGFLTNKFVNPSMLYIRHEQLVNEMLSRGYKHNSPLPIIDTSLLIDNPIDKKYNIKDLMSRCHVCNKNITSIIF